MAMYHKYLQVFLLINIGVWLCGSIPVSYEQTKRTANLLNKLFPGGRPAQDWSSDERSMFQPIGERNNREPELSTKEMLLRDILGWDKRKFEQAEKRQCRILAGMPSYCSQASQDTPEEEAKRRREEWAFREPGHAQMDEMDMEKLKEYDMELEKALSELEIKGPGYHQNQM